MCASFNLSRRCTYWLRLGSLQVIQYRAYCAKASVGTVHSIKTLCVRRVTSREADILLPGFNPDVIFFFFLAQVFLFVQQDQLDFCAYRYIFKAHTINLLVKYSMSAIKLTRCKGYKVGRGNKKCFTCGNQ